MDSIAIRAVFSNELKPNLTHISSLFDIRFIKTLGHLVLVDYGYGAIELIVDQLASEFASASNSRESTIVNLVENTHEIKNL